MGAGGGEHEQRAEGDEEQDQGEQEEIHFLLVALVEGDEEQDQGEQEEIHGVYDFLKIFSSNINFVYSI